MYTSVQRWLIFYCLGNISQVSFQFVRNGFHSLVGSVHRTFHSRLRIGSVTGGMGQATLPKRGF